MLKIDTSLNPFRLKLNRKQPVQLKIIIRNMSNEDALMSYDVVVSRNLSLDKSGFKTSVSNRAGNMEPGQTIEAYFDVYPKTMTKEGTYPLLIKATEHYNNYNFVQKEYKKHLDIQVE